MEWMKLIGDSIQYIEERLDEDLTVDDIACHIGISPFYYQNGSTTLCGFTVVEYIRNRRLALARSEVLDSDRSILEIALKYGYDSPDSFSKAFARFHGSTPSSIRKSRATLKSFAPLKIKVQLEGGYLMDYRMEKKGDFTVIGNGKRFAYGDAKDAIPHFWDEHYASGKGKVVCGEYGICLDEEKGTDSFEYLIADVYHGQEVPEGFTLRSIPAFTWAIFPCKGPMPRALQETNEKIFTEWLPNTREYEIAAGYCVERYGDPRKYPLGMQDENYCCEIWIPVKKRQ